MRILKKIGIGIGALLSALLIAGLFLPSKIHVERSVLIQASPEAIFRMVNDLEQYQRYSPFMAADPQAKISWGDKRVGIGASMSWNGEKTGQGTMTIIDARSPEYVTLDLDFKEKGKAVAFFRFEDREGGRNATWGYDADFGANVPMRYFGLVADKVMGQYFEKGLAGMKEIVEKESPLKAK
ncbi:MAG: SRPBCC family protein [Spirochaetia bacterium]|nr:SRPBCC family protein [Spirochaetia bacterium]